MDLKDMLVAYDMNAGGIYKVWNGEVEWPAESDSLLYRGNAISVGLTYLEQDTSNAWRIFKGGEEGIPLFNYKGYQIQHNQVTLFYSLITPEGDEILVQENPEVTFDEDGRPGLRREFYTSTLPVGVQLTLQVDVESLSHISDLAYEGYFHRLYSSEKEYTWGQTHDLSGRLVLSSDSTSRVSIYFNPGVLRLVKNLNESATLLPGQGMRLALPGEWGEQEGGISGQEAGSHLNRNPGGVLKIFTVGKPIDDLVSLAPGQWPNAIKTGISIDLREQSDFGGEGFYFVSEIEAYFATKEPGTTRIRIKADDGARIRIDDHFLFNGDVVTVDQGWRADSLVLEPGTYALFLEHYQTTGPRELTVEWMPPSDSVWSVMDSNILSHNPHFELRTSAGNKWLFNGEKKLPDWPAPILVQGFLLVLSTRL